MSINEVKSQVDQLGRAWEQFKATNEARLREIEKKGQADSLTSEKLAKLNQVITEAEARSEALETAMERPFSSVKSSEEGNLEYKHAFSAYLRKGQERDLVRLEQKALSAGQDQEGGYLVSPQVSKKISEDMVEISPMRKLASVQKISSDAFEVVEQVGDTFAGWSTETMEREEDTQTPNFGKRVIQVHELYAQPKATQRLIDDASINIEQWLASRVCEVFSRKENHAFIHGDGKGKPRGLLSMPSGKGMGAIEYIKSGEEGRVTSDALIQLVYALSEAYASNASFMMHRSVAESIRLLKDNYGHYLWQPALEAKTPNTLLGIPVYYAVDMPVAAKGSLSIALGDFKAAYQIVDRQGVRVLRDPFTHKPFVKFYTTKRVGGDVINGEAVKLLKLSA